MACNNNNESNNNDNNNIDFIDFHLFYGIGVLCPSVYFYNILFNIAFYRQTPQDILY